MAKGWEPIGRTFTNFRDPIFDPYALAIGRVALVWNELHERLALVFWSVCRVDPVARSFAIWTSLNFDRGRREMLKDATTFLSNDEFEKYPSLSEDVKWLCQKSEDFENIRNDAVHSPLLSGISFNNENDGMPPFARRVFPNTVSQNKRALRLESKDLLSEFEWCYESIALLRDYAGGVYLAMIDDPFPWPDRPALPIRPRRNQRPSGQRKPPVRRKE